MIARKARGVAALGPQLENFKASPEETIIVYIDIDALTLGQASNYLKEIKAQFPDNKILALPSPGIALKTLSKDDLKVLRDEIDKLLEKEE